MEMKGISVRKDAEVVLVRSNILQQQNVQFHFIKL